MTGSVVAGTWVGGYTLIRPLGRGGAGTVWEAKDGGGSRVALKLLHPATAADEAARARILRQARLVNKIPSDRVAKVLDVEADALLPFVVTELVDGPTLEQALAKGPLQHEDAADLAEDLAEVLTSVHASGVAHRDLKPSNIVLANGKPTLIDFELSRGEGDSSLTSHGSVLGTPGYLAPELLASNTGDISALQRGDWFAWSATVLKTLTGLSPFGEGRVEQVIANVSSGVVDTGELPPHLARAFESALQPDPQSRLSPEGVLAVLRSDEDAGDPDETHALHPRTELMPPLVEPTRVAQPPPPLPPAPTPTNQPLQPPQPARQAPPRPHPQPPHLQQQPPHYVGEWIPPTAIPPWGPPEETRYPVLLATAFTLLASSSVALMGANGAWLLAVLLTALQIGGSLGLGLHRHRGPNGRVSPGRAFRMVFTAPLSAVVASLGLAIAALVSFAAVTLLLWGLTALDGYTTPIPTIAEWLVNPQPLFGSQPQTLLTAWCSWWLWIALVWVFPTCGPLRFGFKQVALKVAPSRTKRALATFALLVGVATALVLLL